MIAFPKNFSRDELKCKCGCEQVVFEQRTLDRLQRLRDRFGPMHITSGYRCPTYNEKVSKTGRTGPHTKGAVDVQVTGEKALQLLTLAIEGGFTGIGVSQKGSHDTRFIHLDDLPNATGQPRPWLWSY
jgi:zinc D-Ala-D-Ala carboxypeptidase